MSIALILSVFRGLFVWNTLQIDDRKNRSSAALDQTPLKCESLAGGVVETREICLYNDNNGSARVERKFFFREKVSFWRKQFFWCVAKILIIKQNFSLSASHSEQLQKLLRYLPREREREWENAAKATICKTSTTNKQTNKNSKMTFSKVHLFF